MLLAFTSSNILIVDYNSVKGGLEFIDCIVLSALMVQDHANLLIHMTDDLMSPPQY